MPLVNQISIALFCLLVWLIVFTTWGKVVQSLFKVYDTILLVFNYNQYPLLVNKPLVVSLSHSFYDFRQNWSINFSFRGFITLIYCLSLVPPKRATFTNNTIFCVDSYVLSDLNNLVNVLPHFASLSHCFLQIWA